MSISISAVQFLFNLTVVWYTGSFANKMFFSLEFQGAKIRLTVVAIRGPISWPKMSSHGFLYSKFQENWRGRFEITTGVTHWSKWDWQVYYSTLALRSNGVKWSYEARITLIMTSSLFTWLLIVKIPLTICSIETIQLLNWKDSDAIKWFI